MIAQTSLDRNAIIQIVDLSMVSYRVSYVAKASRVKPSDMAAYTHASLHITESYWLAVLGKPVYTVWCLDRKGAKGYWRNDYLKESGIAYKANRQGYNPYREVAEQTKALLLARLVQGRRNFIVREGYEADDLAATLCRVLDGFKVLATSDTDWMGLIAPDAAWVCLTGYKPRVRYTLEAINEWCSRRLGVVLERPSDIWQVKANQGDSSDNLPANSPIETIDLFNPPKQYDLTQDSDFLDQLGRVQDSWANQDWGNLFDLGEKSALWCRSKGYRPALSPLSFNDAMPILLGSID